MYENFSQLSHVVGSVTIFYIFQHLYIYRHFEKFAAIVIDEAGMVFISELMKLVSSLKILNKIEYKFVYKTKGTF